MTSRRVLILCTGNSCRSQMAEGMVNHHLGGKWKAFSAGTRPSSVNLSAIRVMREIGIDISNHRSKSVDAFMNQSFDLIVTVCDDAARDCPNWPGSVRKIHLGFDDPAEAAGTEDEILSVFRRIRDEIADRLPPLLRSIDDGD